MGEVFAHDRIGDISMDRVLLSDREATSFLLEPGDLLFARQSLVLSGAGKCSIFLGTSEPATFESHLIRVRLAPEKADPRFFYYFFRSPPGRAAIVSIVEQVAAAGIRGSDLAALPVPSVGLAEQKAIAAILSALDDKIELNRRMSQTLESMARAIFKSWFVDFDPVRSKADRLDSGLPCEIADLLPGSFEESEFGEIPRGWGVETVYRIANVIYGAPFGSALFNDRHEGVPLIRIRDLETHDPQISTPETHPRGYLVEPGDLIVGMDGEFRAHQWQGPGAWLNQRLCCFKPEPGVSRAFVHYSIETLLEFFERSKTGTTVIHLGKSDIDTFRVLVPPLPVLRAFGSVSDRLDELIVRMSQEVRILAALRDDLLPRLLSGASASSGFLQRAPKGSMAEQLGRSA